MSDDERDDNAGTPTGIVLDFLPHGRTEDDRPQYEKEPLAYVLDSEEFELYEIIAESDANVTIGDRVDPATADFVTRYSTIEYDDLPGGAKSELEYVIEDLVEEQEQRFVDFYNDAQPITLRLHQLNLLPGIGKKLRNNILDERKRKPFESFEELEERIGGLHDPEQVLYDRIMEELREDDLKYRIFARREEE
ncbi:MAG: putative nucleotide binding protein [Natronomonas sp.]|jgi:putative nucleotide binding protein